MKETIADRYASAMLQPIDELYFSTEDLARVYSNISKQKSSHSDNITGQVEEPKREFLTVKDIDAPNSNGIKSSL